MKDGKMKQDRSNRLIQSLPITFARMGQKGSLVKVVLQVIVFPAWPCLSPHFLHWSFPQRKHR
jgi:hypothetical protein